MVKQSATTVVIGVAAVSAGVYATLSYVLLRNPHWLHKPLPESRRLPEVIRETKVVAHRGSRLEGLPENTVAAFKDAVESMKHVKGMVELDVWLSVDGEVLIHHDPCCSRMCGVEQEITECHSQKLPPIQPYDGQKERLHRWANLEEATTIPTLDAALAAIPTRVPVIVEFKQNSPILIQKVHSLLGKHQRLPHQQHTALWFSLTEEINQALGRADPTIPRIGSAIRSLQLVLDYHTGMLPFRDLREDCQVFGLVCSKVDFARLRNMSAMKMLPDFVIHVLVFLFGGDPPKAMLSRGLIEHVTRRGHHFMILDVNEEQQLEACVRCGATAVLTDRISWIASMTGHLDALGSLEY